MSLNFEPTRESLILIKACSNLRAVIYIARINIVSGPELAITLNAVVVKKQGSL